MRIRHVGISNFRGIRNLDWHVPHRLVCLLGPGDSTKTTILDAIELALTSRWIVVFTDADFHDGDSTKPISITVSIAEPPDDLIAENRFGLYLRGYRTGQPVVDDPDDDCEPVLTVQLDVNEDLEPHWCVVKPTLPEPKQISGRDRERFGIARLGEESDRHLTWSRGSALSRLSGTQSTSQATLAVASRAARKALRVCK